MRSRLGKEILFDSQDNLLLLPQEDSLKLKSLWHRDHLVTGMTQLRDSLTTEVENQSIGLTDNRLSFVDWRDRAPNSDTLSASTSLQTLLQTFFLLQIGYSASAGTPGSDVLFHRATDIYQYQITAGRNGEDTLIAFDPDNTASDDLVYHLLLGDFQEEDATNAKDTFVLGDWQRAYYNDAQTEVYGFKQVAQIADFEIERDRIQLHGSSNQYYLLEVPPTETMSGGTLIFQVSRQGLDLIAIVSGVFDLSLNGDYFQYEGTTAPTLSEGELLGIQHLGSPALDYVSDVAWNPNGDNLLMAGFSSGDLGDGTPPEDIASNADIFFANYDNEGNLLKLQQFGSINSQFDAASSIDTDNQGNLYIVGATDGNLGSRNQTFPDGLEDIFVAKYSSDGDLQWVQQLGAPTPDSALSVDVDPEGEFVYVSGVEIITSEESETIDAASVAKYDAATGEQLWINKFGTPGLNASYGVGVNSQDNVFATGVTRGDLGGMNAGAYDIWLSQFDPDGNQLKTTQFGGLEHEFAWELKLDSQDNIYITGWTESDLGGTLNGAADYFITKYDNNLNPVWLKQFGSSGYDGTYGLYIDANDDLYVSGYTNGILEATNAGGYHAFVSKFDSDGNQLWIQQFGTQKDDQGGRITGDNLGNLYINGITQGSFGDLNAGSVDGWIAKLDGFNGNILDFNPTE